MDSKNLGTCSRDAISLLPDEILGNILSSLPTVQAASTSVLSKKWRHVFRLVNNLDFDDSVWGEYKLLKYGFPESFKNFVDRTLALQCDYPIKKFSLKCHISDNDDGQKACVTNWISNALERGVLELDLCIKEEDMGLRFIPPHQLFASKTLVKLTLGTRFELGKLPSDVSLPSLKTLFINTVFFEDDDLCGVLLAGCTVLEELSIYHNTILAIPETISSPTIKRLSVNYVYPWSSTSFDLPKLVYLECSHFVVGKYPRVNLESLVEAKLDLHTTQELSPDLTDLIMGIRNVEILHLSPSSVDAIYRYCRSELPVFNNLVKLSFGIKYEKDWKLLAHLLKQSPKLETLIIENLYGYICGDVFMNLSKVKVLHILSYRGTDEELTHLKSFLWKTECLEVVQVDVTAEDDCITLQTKKHLMMRLGVSLPSNCQIKVSRK